MMLKRIIFIILMLFIMINCSLLETVKFPTTQKTQMLPTTNKPEITVPPTISPTDTPQPSLTITPNRTATNIAKAATSAAILTQTAQPMNDFVNYLMNESYIP
ncbi:MAG: hypothetical protein ACPL1K_02945, partial [Candidatus Kryptoniota bacterium]